MKLLHCKRLFRNATVLIAALALPAGVLAAEPTASQQPSPKGVADRAEVVVVVGAAGSPEYGPMFKAWADRWRDVAGRARAQLTVIGIEPAGDDGADRRQLQSLLSAEPRLPATRPSSTSPSTLPTTFPSSDATPGADVSAADPLWLVLIGHGTFDGRQAKFNLRGPDVSDDDLASWTKGIARPLVVIDCTSASAPFLNRLSGPNRIVVTATRSGSELQFCRFGDYFAQAVADPSADLDKDGQTSVLEAFLAASHRVEAFYKEAGRLSTEHALLDDNGDALGVTSDFFQGTRAVRAAKSGAAVDGRRAHQVHLILSPAELSLTVTQRAVRDALELKLYDLRDRKATMAPAEYDDALQEVLLEIAKVYHGKE